MGSNSQAETSRAGRCLARRERLTCDRQLQTLEELGRLSQDERLWVALAPVFFSGAPSERVVPAQPEMHIDLQGVEGVLPAGLAARSALAARVPAPALPALPPPRTSCRHGPCDDARDRLKRVADHFLRL